MASGDGERSRTRVLPIEFARRCDAITDESSAEKLRVGRACGKPEGDDGEPDEADVRALNPLPGSFFQLVTDLRTNARRRDTEAPSPPVDRADSQPVAELAYLEPSTGLFLPEAAPETGG